MLLEEIKAAEAEKEKQSPDDEPDKEKEREIFVSKERSEHRDWKRNGELYLIKHRSIIMPKRLR
jgi:hypothetical protein